MDSLKGTLISIAIFALIILPALVDVISMGIVTSQLNKVGAEMIQVIGSSSEYDERTTKAIEVAKDRYKVDVELYNPDSKEAISNYTLGDDVGVRLTKSFTRMLPVPGSETASGNDEFYQSEFTTHEKVLITKRDSE